MWGKVIGEEAAEMLRRLGLVGSMLGAGGLVGLLLLPEPAAQAALPVPVQVVAHTVDPHADAETLATRLAWSYLRTPLRLRAGDVDLSLPRSSVGARIDAGHLAALISRARDPLSPMRRLHAQLRAQAPLSLPLPVQLDTEVALPVLKRIKDEVDRAPVEAKVDARKRQVRPAAEGRRLDLYASLERIEQALHEGRAEIELALIVTKPRSDVRQLERIDMSHTLGAFETPYNRSNKSAARTHNLKVAASKIDGHVLQPGEVFDFNEVVGDRTESNGFKRATVFFYGKLAEDWGGGTCQIASTLHASVFFAGLPILTRNPHSRPSFYIKLGLDAAVADGALNFSFKNDRAYPVVLSMSVSGGQVRASVHGAEQRHRVSFLRRVDSAIPFPEKVIEDDNLPRGLRVLSQRGIPGFHVTRFRVVEDLTTGASRRERSTDHYPPTTQIWRVGTGGDPGPEFTSPPNDAHPEYVADEYLMAVHTPASKQLHVTRKAGRTGTYGWTERENMRVEPAADAAQQSAVN